MNFEKINQEIRNELLILKPISLFDRTFINGMFLDTEIRKYYIVPKEAQLNHQKLIDYWLNDNRNEAGTCWIIIEKGKSVFSRDKNCGFVAFEFRDTLKNARISYAILPEYRRKGIVTSSVQLVIKQLKDNGIERIEADIDKKNIYSEKVVEKLGFSANKKIALIDPEYMSEGEIRLRTLWKKELVELKQIKDISGRVPLDASKQVIVPLFNQIIEEINSKGQQPKLIIRYSYLLGRIKFLERKYDEAKEAFANCNMIIMNEGLPEIHETYYWFGKINEVKGDKGNAKMYYGFALEKYNDNPDYITKQEIEREIRNL